ncbi:GNAT family N-acetyltransferase [Nocardioides jishulii]|uniref:GNAT family N-acetyltransferase n=1 Tax=Nocardioides jishulii TaxID=2575440 RepID=A0A4U2YQU9_9ACTN|nr:GNAT family N-acetyltransferase [Nocardioides jishulii]QCX26416.1 GNAT family N-acetyltransferase [Nocardioides jishulii]TKI63779.1 GNAT family N-acetyltransferase [Nocardioides jishulii]
MVALELIDPDPRLHASWVEVVAEFGGVGAHMHGSGWLFEEFADLSLARLERLVEQLRRDGEGLPWTGGVVKCDYLWIVEGDEMVGFLALRHSLTDALRRDGGHIGYAVRPSRRGEGIATRALGLALDRAAALGLDRVLLTCDDDNQASWRAMLAHGAVLEDVIDGKRRYWIPTSR